MRDAVEGALCFRQPKLDVLIEEGRIVAAGAFVIAPEVDEQRDLGPLSEYEVRIEIDARYPDVEPVVFEIGGAIPREVGFHVGNDGKCCVLIWETWRATASDVSLGAFFDGPLRNFFLSQHAVSLGQDWPFGEWEHGEAGLAAAYAQRLGCAYAAITVRKFLKAYLKILRRRELPVYWRCPCQSGRNVRSCCKDHLSQIMKIVRQDEAQAMLTRISKYKRPSGTKACRHG